MAQPDSSTREIFILLFFRLMNSTFLALLMWCLSDKWSSLRRYLSLYERLPSTSLIASLPTHKWLLNFAHSDSELTESGHLRVPTSQGCLLMLIAFYLRISSSPPRRSHTIKSRDRLVFRRGLTQNHKNTRKTRKKSSFKKAHSSSPLGVKNRLVASRRRHKNCLFFVLFTSTNISSILHLCFFFSHSLALLLLFFSHSARM